MRTCCWLLNKEYVKKWRNKSGVCWDLLKSEKPVKQKETAPYPAISTKRKEEEEREDTSEQAGLPRN